MKWIRPDGTEIEVLDDPGNIAQAKSLGWKPTEVKKPEPSAPTTGQKHKKPDRKDS